jgi:hypothetical protein
MRLRKRYATKDRTVDALHYVSGENSPAFVDLLPSAAISMDGTHLIVKTPGQTLSLAPGDWLLLHPEGDLETLTDAQFSARYTSSVKKLK